MEDKVDNQRNHDKINEIVQERSVLNHDWLTAGAADCPRQTLQAITRTKNQS